MTISRDYKKLYDELLKGNKVICAFQKQGKYTCELDFFEKQIGIIRYTKKTTLWKNHPILEQDYPDTISVSCQASSTITINENNYNMNSATLLEVFIEKCNNLMLEFIV